MRQMNVTFTLYTEYVKYIICSIRYILDQRSDRSPKKIAIIVLLHILKGILEY